MICQLCKAKVTETVSALLPGRYFESVCKPCVSGFGMDATLSSGIQSHERRRQYEDHAQDTIQPYNASGPNAEFYRLYPESAAKIFTKDEIEKVRSKL